MIFEYWNICESLFRIGCIMVSVLASGVVDHGIESRSYQTKDYNIGINCFSAKDPDKVLLVRNQYNL